MDVFGRRLDVRQRDSRVRLDRGERRAKLVRGIGGKPAELRDGALAVDKGGLYPVKRPIERRSELGELVYSGDRQAEGELVRAYSGCRAGHLFHRAKRALRQE